MQPQGCAANHKQQRRLPRLPRASCAEQQHHTPPLRQPPSASSAVLRVDEGLAVRRGAREEDPDRRKERDEQRHHDDNVRLAAGRGSGERRGVTAARGRDGCPREGGRRSKTRQTGVPPLLLSPGAHAKKGLKKCTTASSRPLRHSSACSATLSLTMDAISLASTTPSPSRSHALRAGAAGEAAVDAAADESAAAAAAAAGAGEGAESAIVGATADGLMLPAEAEAAPAAVAAAPFALDLGVLGLRPQHPGALPALARSLPAADASCRGSTMGWGKEGRQRQAGVRGRHAS